MSVIETQEKDEIFSKTPVFNPYKPYRTTLLSSEEVKALSQLRPMRVVRDTIWCWLGIILAWTLVALYPVWWLVLLAIPLIGTRYYGLFMIGHDGLHRRLFSKISHNDLYNDLFIIGPIGAVTHINNANHLLHHIYLTTSKDPDRHKHCCVNKTEISEVFYYITGFVSFIRSVRDVYIKPLLTNTRPTETNSKPQRKTKKYSRRDLIIIFGWQIGLLIGLTVFVNWWAYPVLWLLPVYLFTYLGDNLRSFIEHSHPEADELADEHRLITHISNPIERMFIAPMNMNYHATHHLWPSIPYYNLPMADAKIRNHPLAEGLIWRYSYTGYLIRYLLALPLEECKLKPSLVQEKS